MRDADWCVIVKNTKVKSAVKVAKDQNYTEIFGQIFNQKNRK